MTHVDTYHGAYDALPARDTDNPPAGATHTVFHESGALAGYVAAGFSWDATRGGLGYPVTLAGAVAEVAGADVPAHGYDEHGAHARADICTDLRCTICGAPAGEPCEIWCIADQALPPS